MLISDLLCRHPKTLPRVPVGRLAEREPCLDDRSARGLCQGSPLAFAKMLLRSSRSMVFSATVAVTRRERTSGLRGVDALAPEAALYIPRCRSVHTLGMRFTITAAFLDADLRVVAVKRMPPGRVALPRFRARHVLECADGADIRPGDQLYETHVPPTLPVTFHSPFLNSTTLIPPEPQSPPHQ